MPEAVIVSAARSPIGRVGKGLSRNLRPDDSGARIVRAAPPKRLPDKQIGPETMCVGGGRGTAMALEGLS
jgi:acetyl-CoA acetyltransferase